MYFLVLEREEYRSTPGKTPQSTGEMVSAITRDQPSIYVQTENKREKMKLLLLPGGNVTYSLVH